MNGADLIKLLEKDLKPKNSTELASMLGVASSRISQLRKDKDVSAKVIASLIENSTKLKISKAIEQSINPIVEFFEIDGYQPRNKNWHFLNHKENADLHARLKSSKGIYSFYNSEGKIIYVGKTKNNFITEMQSAFEREIPAYKIHITTHKGGNFSSERDIPIRKVPTKISDTACYFSAYEIANDLIPSLEALIIRLIPNNVINSRMERVRKKKKVK